MTAPIPDDFRDLVAGYLDGTLSDAERAALEERLATDEALRLEVELQRRIDGALARRFAVPEAPAELPDMSANSGATAAPTTAPLWPDPGQQGRASWRSRRTLLILATLAATVGWALFLWQLAGGPKPGLPAFQPEPLAKLYDDAVRTGFEPYWECPPERFAQTFQERQGVPLEMTEMPPDRRMLGLAYPGGLSRDTTAVLCRVGEAPVMVFVDRLADDHPQPAPAADSETRMFRRELDGLVLYEFSPFAEPQMLEYLRVRPSSPAKVP